MSDSEIDDPLGGCDVAVIGMAGRFPGADTIDQFWRNLEQGVESIRRFSAEELDQSGFGRGASPGSEHVPAGAVLDDIEFFDADFFGFTPKEAEIMDPQHRIFLETAWAALESAGYAAGEGAGTVGVYAGSLLSTYLLNVYSNPDILNSVGMAQVGIGNHVDFLPTMLSYKLGLSGPSVAIQTACSTSLVATHVACQALLNGECDTALAGGVAVRTPQRSGYQYQQGGILSPDGRCRAFDSEAEGTVFGNGVGIVVLKRLADAIADGDTVRAVIKGSAINNDGALKVGFTAPSVQGQSSVIVEALAAAGVSADTIGYVEAHGTGTTLGDPIEVQALTEAFRVTTEQRGYCPIGSVKTNVGHLDAAAGVTGLIKVILALEHEAIPPSLNCVRPNPRIDFASSPFFVNTELRRWERSTAPRRAGVSSLGIGGTNAHLVVEEAPALPEPEPARDHQLLILSGKTERALDMATRKLADHLRRHPEANLADVAYTLQLGRKPFDVRRALVCDSVAAAVAALESDDRKRLSTGSPTTRSRPVAFMFSGQGSQHAGMATDLYSSEPLFRDEVDRCAVLLRDELTFDLLAMLFGPDQPLEERAGQADRTAFAQPALFVIEYALARWLMRAGLEPRAMIGHSLGEIVAACLAGVFSLEDALRLVAARGRLMQGLDEGAMVSVRLSEQDACAWLNDELSLAAVNGAEACVISGSMAAVSALERALMDKGVPHQRLRTSHAFHSAMMEPALAPLRAVLDRITFKPPRIPFLSNVTGTWTTDDVTTPAYWLEHLRGTVKFAAGIDTLLGEQDTLLIEVGPGGTLCDLVRAGRRGGDGAVAIPTMRHASESRNDVAHLLGAVGKIWLAGGHVDWRGLHEGQRRRRVDLPTYPFERRRFWIDPKPLAAPAAPAAGRVLKKADIEDWFYLPSWRRSLRPAAPEAGQGADPSTWLLLMDGHGIGERLARSLEGLGQRCVRVFMRGDAPTAVDREFEIDPASPNAWDDLLQQLLASDRRPRHVVHLWTLDPNSDDADANGPDNGSIDRGFYALLHMGQAIIRANVTDPVKLWLISNELHALSSCERIVPEKTMALGPCLVLPQEHANFRSCSLDVDTAALQDPDAAGLADLLVAEFLAGRGDPAILYRGRERWRQVYEPIAIGAEPQGRSPMREGGVYLILGGLGRLGLLIAEHLARTHGAKLVLTSREALPPREEWPSIIAKAAELDPAARRLAKLIELETLGAELLVRPLDMPDPRQLVLILEEATSRFGAIHGVIHAAGVQEHTPILGADRESCEHVFAPKVRGLFDLEEALRGREIDFCLLTSSLSPILGGLGFVAYSASNLLLDAFAERVRRNGAPWRSINWEGWHRTDLADAAAAPATGFGGDLTRLVMTDDEVADCFRRAVAAGERAPRLIIATGDLEQRVDQWVKLQSVPHGRKGKPVDPTGAASAPPTMRADYVAPRDEMEETIVEIARSILGIEDIGVHDHFFEMGGSSLLAVQLISAIRERYQQQLPLRALFDRPTIAGIVEVIREGLNRDEDMLEISSLLEEIETLDEEEVQRRLSEAEGVTESA